MHEIFSGNEHSERITNFQGVSLTYRATLWERITKFLDSSSSVFQSYHHYRPIQRNNRIMAHTLSQPTQNARLHEPILIWCMRFFSGNEHIWDLNHVLKVSRIRSRFESGWETIILRPKSVIYKVIFLWNYISPTRKLSKLLKLQWNLEYRRTRLENWILS